MNVNIAFERALKIAIDKCKKNYSELRTLMIIEWSNISALFEMEYVVKGEHQKRCIYIEF